MSVLDPLKRPIATDQQASTAHGDRRFQTVVDEDETGDEEEWERLLTQARSRHVAELPPAPSPMPVASAPAQVVPARRAAPAPQPIKRQAMIVDDAELDEITEQQPILQPAVMPQAVVAQRPAEEPRPVQRAVPRTTPAADPRARRSEREALAEVLAIAKPRTRPLTRRVPGSSNV